MTLRHRLLAARLAYVAVILIATLMGLEFTPDPAAAMQRLGRALLPSLRWSDAIDGLRNLALFAGLGALWVVTSAAGNVRREIRSATLVGLIMSLAVEALQLFSPVREASILDVATNTIGTSLGAITIAFLAGQVKAARQARSYFGVPAFLLGGAYGLAVLCEALTPLFRSEPLPGADGGPLARMKIAMALTRPLSIAHVSLTDFLLFAPAGFLIVTMLVERGRDVKRVWPAVAVIGAVVTIGAELGHGVLGISVRFEAAVVYGGAMIFGAWAARRWLSRLSQVLRGASRARAVIIGYVVVLLLWGWRPFYPVFDLSLITAQLGIERFIPLASLSGRDDVFSALHVIQTSWLYVPLGALLAVWPVRLTGTWSDLWPVVWLVGLMEAGHLVLADRFFDVTNALLGFAGAGVAWLVVRRCGFAPYGEAFPATRTVSGQNVSRKP